MPIYKIEGQKRGGLQKYRVVVNWTDAAGKKKRKERLVCGKGQAEAAEAEMRKLLEEGALRPVKRKTPAPSCELTLKQLLDLYEAEHGGEIRASTLAKKKSVLQNHVMPELGKTPLCDLTDETLRAWRARIGALDQKVSTKNSAYKVLRALLNYAVARKLIEKSPMSGLRPFRDPCAVPDSVKLRYYTKDEFQKFIAEGKKEAETADTLRAWGIYIFFMLAYYTGMRKGEINALRWTDADGSCIWVRHSITQKIKGEKWLETPPKTPASVRRIQMPAPLIAALDEHKARQMKAEGWEPSLFICGGPAPIPDTVLENANKNWGERAGLPHITVHEFRHSHASLLCNAGINIKEIARRLGHSDVETTLKTYAHLYPKEEERAVAVLNNL